MDRRGFIKFAVGAVAGLHVTPIPWKLTDDIAIWTQNWPWVPDPKNGKIAYRNVSGGFNGCGCGLRVRLVDGKRAVSVSGNPDHPLNQGGICPSCASSLQYFYNKRVRLTSPMKQKGGVWISISWDEALSTIQEKLVSLRTAGTPNKVAMVRSESDSATSEVMKRFMEAYGSPNVMSMPSMKDTNALVAKLMFGAEGGLGYDLANSDYVLSFGSDLIGGWGDHVHSMLAYEKLLADPKKTLVQVEPNLSITASKANTWIPLTPGTEAALALSMACVIIQEKLYDQAVENDIFGLEDGTDQAGKTFTGFKSMVAGEYVPEKAAEITGVPAEKIIELAKKFAAAKSPVAVAGKGKGIMPGDTSEYMAIMSLNALVGSINRKGGCGPVFRPPVAPLPEVSRDDIAEEGLKSEPVGGGSLQGFAQAINANGKTPIELLLVDGSNPAYESPDSRGFAEALEKIPFIVCISPFYNETVQSADLALPACTFLEQWDDLAGSNTAPFPLYQVTAPTFQPIYTSRSTGELFFSFAKAMEGSVAESMPWESMEEIVKIRSSGVYKAGSGMMAEPGSLGKTKGKGFSSEDTFWKKLATTGCWYDPANAVGNSAKGAYSTPSGKIELYAQTPRGGVMGKYHRVELSGDASQYPLIMMPYEVMWVSSDGLASAPYLTKIFPNTLLLKHDLFVNINPVTASELRISEGDRIEVRSMKGSLKVRAHLFEGVRPGIVAVPEGFGHTAFDKFMKDKGVNVREIVGVQTDELSGYPMWWGTRVNLMRI